MTRTVRAIGKSSTACCDRVVTNKNTLLPILMILMPVIVLTLVMLIAGSQEKSVAADKDQVKVDEAVEGRP